MFATSAEAPLPTTVAGATRPTVLDLHMHATAIAAVAGWHYNVAQSKNADGELCYRAVIGGDDWQVALAHEVQQGNGNRLTVRAFAPYALPTGQRFHEPYEFKVARCTFAWERGADAVASAIARKVVPNARTLAAHYDQAARDAVALSKRHAHAVSILRVAGFTVHDERNPGDLDQSFYARLGETALHGHVRSGRCALDRLTVDADDAVSIALLLGALA